MSNYLEKTENLSLAVNVDKPRLFAALRENANEIINAVELEQKGAHSLITSHYFSLPFSSKPESYWIEKNMKYEELLFTKFQFDYMGWSIMVGIRNLPDQIVLGDVLECLKESFGIHNEESIKTAIKMNLRGDFEEVFEPFGQINRVFITKIMSAYEKKLLKAHKRAIEIRNKLDEPQELTEQEKEFKLIVSIQDVFEQFKQVKNNQSVELISHAIYDYLAKKGIIVLTKEQKDSLMTLSSVEVAVLKGKGISVNEILKDEFKADRVSMAKRMAVRNYFNSIETLNLV